MLGHLGLEIVDGDAAGLLRVLPGRQAGGVLIQRGRLRNNTPEDENESIDSCLANNNSSQTAFRPTHQILDLLLVELHAVLLHAGLHHQPQVGLLDQSVVWKEHRYGMI